MRCWQLGCASDCSTSPRVPGEESAAASFQPVPTPCLADPAAIGWHLPHLSTLFSGRSSARSGLWLCSPVPGSYFCSLYGRALPLGHSGPLQGLPSHQSSLLSTSPTPHEVWSFPIAACFPQTSVRVTRTQLLITLQSGHSSCLRTPFFPSALVAPEVYFQTQKTCWDLSEDIRGQWKLQVLCFISDNSH